MVLQSLIDGSEPNTSSNLKITAAFRASKACSPRSRRPKTSQKQLFQGIRRIYCHSLERVHVRQNILACINEALFYLVITKDARSQSWFQRPTFVVEKQVYWLSDTHPRWALHKLCFQLMNTSIHLCHTGVSIIKLRLRLCDLPSTSAFLSFDCVGCNFLPCANFDQELTSRAKTRLRNFVTFSAKLETHWTFSKSRFAPVTLGSRFFIDLTTSTSGRAIFFLSKRMRY